MLFSIAKTKLEGEWEDFPDYQLLGFENGEYYLLLRPTDVQFDVSDAVLIDEFIAMDNEIDIIIKSFVFN